MNERAIWLALVGHADRLGVVTRCAIATLADYARVRPAQARAIVEQLSNSGRLRILQTSSKRNHYHLLGEWRNDREAARQFLSGEGERVRSLQNRRSRLHEVAKNESLGPDIRLADLDTKQNTTRFTLRIAGVGLIRNCAMLKRENGTYYLGEPAKRLGSKWEKLCLIDPTIASEAINAALHPREDVPMRWSPPVDFSISSIIDVPVDGTTCRWRVRFSLDIPGIVIVHDCAVMEQLDGSRIVVGPSKNVAGKWERAFVVEHNLADRIIQRILQQRLATA